MAPKKRAPKAARKSTKVDPIKIPATPNVFRADHGEGLPPQAPIKPAK